MEPDAGSVKALSLADYCTRFSLGEAERRLSILGCGDGASSFNAEGTAQGMRIVSVDALYRHRAAEIRAHIDAAARDAAATQAFLADYAAGLDQGRYVSGELPDLPFHDGCYDLALCLNLLFTDDARQDLAFHLRALQELMRVAEEVRVAPMPEAGSNPARHLSAVLLAMSRSGFSVKNHGGMLGISR